MKPNTLVVELTEKQKGDLARILREYVGIKKKIVYEAIISHGIAAIFKKHKWDT